MASPAAIDIKQIAIESAEFLLSRTQTLCVKAGTLARAHRGRVKTDPRVLAAIVPHLTLAQAIRKFHARSPDADRIAWAHLP